MSLLTFFIWLCTLWLLYILICFASHRFYLLYWWHFCVQVVNYLFYLYSPPLSQDTYIFNYWCSFIHTRKLKLCGKLYFRIPYNFFKVPWPLNTSIFLEKLRKLLNVIINKKNRNQRYNPKSKVAKKLKNDVTK